MNSEFANMILMMTAKVKPMEEVLTDIEEAIATYRSTKDTSTLALYCSVLLAKLTIDKVHNGDVAEALDNMQRKTKAMKFFDTPKN